MPGDFLDTSAFAKALSSGSGKRRGRPVVARSGTCSLHLQADCPGNGLGLRGQSARTSDLEREFRIAADATKAKRLSVARLLVSHYQEAERDPSATRSGSTLAHSRCVAGGCCARSP